MKYLTLETLEDFVCTGDKCEFTCCGGWNIAIDKETDEYYKTVEGEIGDLLKTSIRRKNGKSSFILNDKGKCPFLNEKGLCNIYINLGEEHLSNACTYYPRYTFYSGDICFGGVSISCPEVADFFLTHKEPLQIDFAEDSEPVANDLEIDWSLFNHSIRSFTCAVSIAQARDIFIPNRLALLTMLIHSFQSAIEEHRDPSALLQMFTDPNNYPLILGEIRQIERDYPSKIKFFSEIMGYFSRIDSISSTLPELSEIIEYFKNRENSQIYPEQLKSAYDSIYCEENSIWLDNFITYLLYRYYMQGFGDSDFYRKYLTGIVLVYGFCIGIITLYHIIHDHMPNKKYMIILIAHISRSVEHDISFRDKALQHFESRGMTDPDFILRLFS